MRFRVSYRRHPAGQGQGGSHQAAPSSASSKSAGHDARCRRVREAVRRHVHLKRGQGIGSVAARAAQRRAAPRLGFAAS